MQICKIPRITLQVTRWAYRNYDNIHYFVFFFAFSQTIRGTRGDAAAVHEIRRAEDQGRAGQ